MARFTCTAIAPESELARMRVLVAICTVFEMPEIDGPRSVAGCPVASSAANRLVLSPQGEARRGMIESSDRADLPARLGMTFFARAATGAVCKLAVVGVSMAVRAMIEMLNADMARRELRLR